MAHADDPVARIVSIRAPGVVINSNAPAVGGDGCREVPVTVTWAITEPWSVDVGSLLVYDGMGNPIRPSSLDVENSYDQPAVQVLKYRWCPLDARLGVIKVGGDTQLLVTDWVDPNVPQQELLDTTSTTFKVKYASKASLAVKHKGSTVTITAHAKHYAIYGADVPGYIPMSVTATLQKRVPGGWKRLQSVSVRQGVAVVKRKDRSRHAYRLVIPESGHSWGSTSAVVSG